MYTEPSSVPTELSESPRCIMPNLLDCDIVVNDIELKSLYYIHFQTNTLENSMKSFISPAMD